MSKTWFAELFGMLLLETPVLWKSLRESLNSLRWSTKNDLRSPLEQYSKSNETLMQMNTKSLVTQILSILINKTNISYKFTSNKCILTADK